MSRVAISTSSFGRVSEEPLEILRQAGHELVRNPHGRVLERAETKELLAGARGLIAGTECLDREVLASAPELRVVSRMGSGTENVDFQAAADLGIVVCSTPGPPARAVAELALGGILAALRQFCAADRALRLGRWHKPMGRLLAGKTVGIVGTGRAGRALVELLGPFGCRLVATDLAPDADWAAPRGVQYLELDELVTAADVISIHVPLTPDNRHLFGRRRLELLRDGAVFVNCARGGLVDEEALADNLDSGRLAGAFIDVFEVEPYHGPLTEAPNTILSPHIGSYAAETRLEMEVESVRNLIRELSTEGGS